MPPPGITTLAPAPLGTSSLGANNLVPPDATSLGPTAAELGAETAVGEALNIISAPPLRSEELGMTEETELLTELRVMPPAPREMPLLKVMPLEGRVIPPLTVESPVEETTGEERVIPLVFMGEA